MVRVIAQFDDAAAVAWTESLSGGKYAVRVALYRPQRACRPTICNGPASGYTGTHGK